MVLLTLLYLLPAVAAIRPVLDPDIWWHLRTGQWIVEHGAVLTTDPFSSYGMGKPWIAYSWLFEILIYSLYQAFGLLGLMLYAVVFSVMIAAALRALVGRLVPAITRCVFFCYKRNSKKSDKTDNFAV